MSHVKRAIRANYSNPPYHGGAVVATVLGDKDLRAAWDVELAEMRNRINNMRTLFVDTMKRKVPQRDYSFIATQRGMFSFAGLTPTQVDELKTKHAIYIVGNGRIAGISGIFGQLLPPARSVVWRVVFLAALVLGALLASYLIPGLGVGGPAGQPAKLAAPPANWSIPAPLWIAVSGLLIGFGTKVGNGCTSGHGVCGIARLSKRSFVAVGVFFGVAILTVTLTGIV